MVATSQPASTLAGIETLRRGGNAVDAAVAASAVQAVVEPHSTGLGGDCFVLLSRNGSDDIIALNGSGHAPQAATTDAYRELGIDQISLTSAHAVTVPGAVDAWAKLLEDHGTMTLAEVLEPAIGYAEEGYVVHPRSANDWPASMAKLRQDRSATRIFLPGGRPPAAGDIIRQPELAETLKRIANDGRDGFYKGPVADDLVGHLTSLGGLHALDDFAAQACEYVQPITSAYRGYHVHQCPPNGQGIAVLIMLGILEGFDLSDHAPDSVERMHLESEATRLAYYEAEQTVADPRQAEVPVDHLLSQAHICELRERVRIDARMDDVPDTAPMHPETIYISVVDKDRNAVSFINSVCFAFGSGLVGPKSGVLLQNRGAAFSLDPEHPNAIAPRKRPRHTIIPGMVSKDGRAVMPFGVMGGQFQPVGQVHVLSNIIDYNMDLQAALDHGRGFCFAGTLELETTIPHETARGLAAYGHAVKRAELPLGSGQAVWIDWDRGALIGASDPRKDGMALGY
jgi:gamma-glutamyltranspeptidase/glutathione hydrolase